MKPQNPITLTYELYLPSKNVFITSGDVVFCEHVDRSKPERLLPPVLMLPPGAKTLDPADLQHLVDNIHMDNDEGSTYRILKVYKRAGNAIVDRVLYSNDKNKDLGGKVDTVYLDNIIQYPIFLTAIPAGTAMLASTPMTTDFMITTDLSSNQSIPDPALRPIVAPPETHTRDGEGNGLQAATKRSLQCS